MKLTAAWAAKINLVTMRPNQDFGAASFCLGNSGQEYLMYVEGSNVDLDLTSLSGNFSVEWMHLTEGTAIPDKTVSGGKMHAFRNPLTSEVILHLKLIDKGK
jgi:hypothetical protein